MMIGQSGPTAGGVDIYYYLSGHIAPYCVAYYECYIQSHFWLRAGILFHCEGETSVCPYSKTLHVHARSPLNRTALGLRSAQPLY